MGIYINPGNQVFRERLNGRYVDKSGLVSVINGTINTDYRLSCISRPRRFGKSIAAEMLAAYYDRTVDSSGLFDKTKYKIALKRLPNECFRDRMGVMKNAHGGGTWEYT